MEKSSFTHLQISLKHKRFQNSASVESHTLLIPYQRRNNYQLTEFAKVKFNLGFYSLANSLLTFFLCV